MTRVSERLVGRVSGLADAGFGLIAYAEAVCEEIHREVPSCFSCFGITDPASGLIVHGIKSQGMPVSDEEIVRFELGPEDINKFADLARREGGIGSLWLDTGGRPQICRRYAEFLHPQLGFTDELRIVFTGAGLTWGVLGMHRDDAGRPFTLADRELLRAAAPEVVRGLRRALVRVVDSPPPGAPDGPAVVIVNEASDFEASAGGWHAIDQLGGLLRGDLPVCLLTAVGRVRAGAASAMVRARTEAGDWLTVRAAPLREGSAGPGSVPVVLSVAPTSPAELIPLTLDAYAMTRREQEVAGLVLQGASTTAIASSLHLSAHTVQDHLKSIFRKAGVSSRRDLVAQLLRTR